MKIRAEEAHYWAREVRLRAKAAAHAFGLVHIKNVRDPDYYLRLGNLLKRRGRFEEAAGAFRRSFELNASRAAYIELIRLCGSNAAFPLIEATRPHGVADTVYFEIDLLLTWGRQQATLSGVQRVAVGILQQVLAHSEKNPAAYAFVFGCVKPDGFWLAAPADVGRLINAFVGASSPQRHLIRIIETIERRAVVGRTMAGQCYFALWAFHDDTTRFARLKAAGVVLGMYVYDLIALTHQEYFDEPQRHNFALATAEDFAIFDFALTISEFTARETRRFQGEHHLRQIPVEAVPLAHSMPEKPRRGASWDRAIAPLRTRPFVLFVSTIEARKNHAYLVDIWTRFLEEGLDPPDLAFVGREGWLVEDLMARLKATNYLGGRIHVLHGVSDHELETLYRHCLFTTFPSFVEGWGLPVGESLMHGRPCIASNSSSIPEVGGDLVDYIDPHDINRGYEVFRRMIVDDDYRVRREQAVRKNFVPRTWEQVTDELLAAIARLRRLAPDPLRPPLLFPGEIFAPGELHRDGTLFATYFSRPLRLILTGPWLIEHGKCAWMRGEQEDMRFRTDLAPGTEIVVHLLLIGTALSGKQTVEIGIGSFTPSAPSVVDRAAFPLNAGETSLCHATGKVAPDGTVAVHLSVSGGLASSAGDAHEFGLGLFSFSYEASDPARGAAIVATMMQAEPR